MTSTEKLKHFMKPYYQEITDISLLETYIADYAYPECAASVLWFELAGELGFQMDGVQKLDTGAEKFVYSEPGTMQLACEKQGKYFAERCNDLNGYGSVMVKVAKGSVGGIAEEFGSSNE